MKVWEILCVFTTCPSNCPVLMMFSRIFQTIFTTIMKICPLSNMAELTVKSPITHVIILSQRFK